jgi:hypothetical protein
MAAHCFVAAANKDGSATILGIVTARGGSGAAIIDEHGHNIGNAVKQADLTAITCVVTDTSTSPEMQTVAPPVTIALAISDTIQQGGLWYVDPLTGYNFTHDLPPAAFPNRQRVYRAVYKFVMSDGVTVGVGEVLLTT